MDLVVVTPSTNIVSWLCEMHPCWIDHMIFMYYVFFIMVNSSQLYTDFLLYCHIIDCGIVICMQITILWNIIFSDQISYSLGVVD